MIFTVLATVVAVLLVGAILLRAKRWSKTDLLRSIVERRGYRLQVHHITTADGYILTLHRIVTKDYDNVADGKKDENNNNHLKPNNRAYNSTRRPILIAHGLFCSSIDFLYTCSTINGKRSESFVAYLLESGQHDVWLLNHRANCFSKGHLKLKPSDPQYWKFSIDQLAAEDLPLAVDYVREQTDHQSISFVGFSQGNLLMFALLSERPEYARRISPFIAWAPAVFFGSMDSPIRGVARWAPLFRWLGGQYPLFRFTSLLGRTFRPTPIVQWVTAILFRSTMGRTNYWAHTRLPVWLHLFPSSGSTWQFVHHLQWVLSGRFTKFDYGSSRENMAAYGVASPPEYPLERIPPETRLVLMRAATDTMTTDRDTDRLVDILRPRLPHLIDMKVRRSVWNHLDFIMNVNAGKVVYEPTMRLLEQFTAEQKTATAAVDVNKVAVKEK